LRQRFGDPCQLAGLVITHNSKAGLSFAPEGRRIVAGGKR
jgi:hypothetical protein